MTRRMDFEAFMAEVRKFDKFNRLEVELRQSSDRRHVSFRVNTHFSPPTPSWRR